MPSISPIKEPGYYDPLYSELYFVSGSSDSNLPGFRYYFDLYTLSKDANGFKLPIVFKDRFVAPVRPSTGYGVWSAHIPLQSFVNPSVDPKTNNIRIASENAIMYLVQHGFGWNPQLTYGSVSSNGISRGSLISISDWVNTNKPQGAVYDGTYAITYGYYYIRLTTTTAHGLSVGDKVTISKSRKGYNSYIDGETTVRSVISSTVIELNVMWSSNNWTGNGNPGSSAAPAWLEIGQIVDVIRMTFYSSYLASYIGTKQQNQLGTVWFNRYRYDPLNTATYASSSWLTNWDHSSQWKKVYRDQLETISFLSYKVFNINEYKVVVYDKSMTALGTRYIGFGTFPYTDLINYEFHHYSVQIGYDKVMSQALPSAINAFPTAKYYTIQLGYGNAGPSNYHGIAAKYEIVDRDCYIENTRICWLNRLGGYDYFNFAKKTTRTVNINRKEWTKNLPYNATISDRSKSVLSTTASETFEATTDNLTYEEYLFLEELITSPDAYVVKEDGTLLPIVITSDNYVTPDPLSEPGQLTLEYKANTNIIIQ